MQPHLAWPAAVLEPASVCLLLVARSHLQLRTGGAGCSHQPGLAAVLLASAAAALASCGAGCCRSHLPSLLPAPHQQAAVPVPARHDLPVPGPAQPLPTAGRCQSRASLHYLPLPKSQAAGPPPLALPALLPGLAWQRCGKRSPHPQQPETCCWSHTLWRPALTRHGQRCGQSCPQGCMHCPMWERGAAAAGAAAGGPAATSGRGCCALPLRLPRQHAQSAQGSSRAAWAAPRAAGLAASRCVEMEAQALAGRAGRLVRRPHQGCLSHAGASVGSLQL